MVNVHEVPKTRKEKNIILDIFSSQLDELSVSHLTNSKVTCPACKRK